MGLGVTNGGGDPVAQAFGKENERIAIFKPNANRRTSELR